MIQEVAHQAYLEGPNGLHRDDLQAGFAACTGAGLAPSERKPVDTVAYTIVPSHSE